MLFNSIDFALFLPIVYVLYWLIPNKNNQLRNVLLLGASYYFYGWWNWYFLILILTSTLVDYFCALGIEKHQNKRKLFLYFSLAANLGILFFFKYFNFFIESLHSGFQLFGNSLNIQTLQILLPIGISFYTFQTMSYTIDVYRGKLKPTTNILAFAVFVAFFPQLVAGPIERASNLLPQFFVGKKFNYTHTVDGLQQILWGLFKKIVIADTCGRVVDLVYTSHQTATGSTLLVGVLLFSIQIYADFSGYTDIAIGTARLFGFNLQPNFNYPLFAKNIPDFWSRWHISLLSWLRDYIYIPLGGNRLSRSRTYLNILLVFLISGLWHGAAWTFICYGLLHGILYVTFVFGRRRKIASSLFRSKYSFLSILKIFVLVSLTRVLFRSASLQQAAEIWSGICSASLFSIPTHMPVSMVVLVALFLVIEWNAKLLLHPLQLFNKAAVLPRWSIYYSLIALILYFAGEPRVFLYFQF